MLAAVSRGESVDEVALAAAATASSLDVMRKQADAGVDVINSGEQSRVSFSTYVTQRISGFGGVGTAGAANTKMSFRASSALEWSS